MPTFFFGLKSCDSCRAALKSIDAAGLSVEVKDVRDDGVPEAMVAAAVARHRALDIVVNNAGFLWDGV